MLPRCGLKRIAATDLSTRMIEIARERAATRGVTNVDFAPGTLFDEALETGSFDVVMAFNLLHLLEDLPSAVARIAGLLKPGGRFISKTVCLAEQSRLWSVAVAAMRLIGFAPYVHCMTIAELEEVIRSSGFEIVDTEVFPVRLEQGEQDLIGSIFFLPGHGFEIRAGIA